ncbi:hypothetical protein [Conexibacter woesei]|nr:hypothetical protein [Conexibacter woesei]
MFHEPHWAEGDSSRRERGFRTAVLADVLAPHRLGVRDFGGTRYMVADGKGRTVLADSLDAVWAAAEQLLGRPVDPLA